MHKLNNIVCFVVCAYSYICKFAMVQVRLVGDALFQNVARGWMEGVHQMVIQIGNGIGKVSFSYPCKYPFAFVGFSLK